GKDSSIAKDLRLNLRRILEEGALGPEDGYLALLAAASSAGYGTLKQTARTKLAELGFGQDQIREAEESAAIMAMLNTYYRFRHMIGKDEYYHAASLRMASLARPVIGKERFEMLAFTVSVMNGCESCTRSHEAVLRNAGVSVEKIHDL